MLHSGLRLDLNSMAEDITTAIVFHNIATELRIEGPDLDGPLYEEDEDEPDENVFQNNDLNTGSAYRNEIVRQIFA